VTFIDSASIAIPFLILAIGLGIAASEIRLALGRYAQRRRARRGNGKILVVGNSDHPAFIATSVLVTYEGATINGIAGHRFTVLRWLDDRRLGGGWAPGPLSVAQREVAGLCKAEAWTQGRMVRS
jgi:hypothetical protein